MKQSYGMWINGKEVPAKSGKTFAVVNPATQAELCQVAAGDADDVTDAVNNALEAFEDGRWVNIAPREKCRIMNRAAQLLRDRLDYIIDIEVKSTGRALREMKAQIPRVPEWLEYFGSLVQVRPLGWLVGWLVGWAL